MLRGMSSAQTFPYYNFFTLLQLFNDLNLFHHEKKFPCNLWSKEWTSQTTSFDVKALSQHESNAYTIYIKRSTISHLRTRMSCSVTQILQLGKILWFYFGTSSHSIMLHVLSAGGHCREKGEVYLQIFFGLSDLSNKTDSTLDENRLSLRPVQQGSPRKDK